MNDEGRLLRRLIGVWVVLAAAFIGLGGRVVWLHLGAHPELHALMDQAREVRQTLVVNRGRVLDRNGAILATDRLVYDINADPKRLTEEALDASVAAHLARVLGLDRAAVLAKCRQPRRRQVFIARAVSEDMGARIQSLKLPHVWVEAVSARHYPLHASACHAIGFSNVEGHGLAGVELGFDTNLRGVPGELVSMRDAHGREHLIRRITERPPEPGDTIELTIDLNLQRIMEEALSDAVATNRAQGAWSIMMDVRTGEILALASCPAYDLNEYGRANTEAMLNRAIGYSYEPGSTFKVAIIAAALNEGLVTPERVFDCEHGVWMFNGRPLHDYHPYGLLSVADVLKKSSNIGAAKIALLLGPERMEQYLRAFGVGARTGIELPGEETGLLHPSARWHPLDITRIAMGHSVVVTSAQILNIVACLGNDGVRMRPSVIRRITSRRGIVLETFVPRPLAHPVRPETAQLMVRLMTRVTEDGGTGKRAAVPGYAVAGKTGTSVKLTNGRYDGRRNIASFAGLIPATRPRLAMIVVIDEPQSDHTGGVVAGPVFSRIAREAVNYLDIPPDGEVRPVNPDVEEPDAVEEGDYVAGIAI